jgi:hypothetical protein
VLLEDRDGLREHFNDAQPLDNAHGRYYVHGLGRFGLHDDHGTMITHIVKFGAILA